MAGEKMADISARITRKSLAAKKKAAIKTIKAQAKEKIREVQIQYAANPERIQARAAEKEQKKALRQQKLNARLTYNARQPRQFTLAEDIFNAISHGIGAGLSVAALVILITHAYLHAEAPKSTYITAFSIFGSSLFIMYMMSTLYHAITPYTARKVFSIMNHIAIYILIAGTYTPFALSCLNGTAGLVAFVVVWGITLALSALYAVFGAKLRTFSIFSYVTFGWIFIFMTGFLDPTKTINPLSQNFIVIGGISYTIGGALFLLRKFKWTHSISHLFTLAGSILHFFAVYFLVSA